MRNRNEMNRMYEALDRVAGVDNRTAADVVRMNVAAYDKNATESAKAEAAEEMLEARRNASADFSL